MVRGSVHTPYWSVLACWCLLLLIPATGLSAEKKAERDKTRLTFVLKQAGGGDSGEVHRAINVVSRVLKERGYVVLDDSRTKRASAQPIAEVEISAETRSVTRKVGGEDFEVFKASVSARAVMECTGEVLAAENAGHSKPFDRDGALTLAAESLAQQVAARMSELLAARRRTDYRVVLFEGTTDQARALRNALMSRGGVALASECGQLGDAPVLAVSVEKAKEAAFNRLVLTQLGDLGFQEFGVLSREGETFYLQRSRPAAKPSAESPLKPPSKPVTEEFPKKPPAAPSAATGAVPTYKQGYDDSLAVVIGIDKYANWSPLAYAVSDAESIREHLRSTGFNTISFLVDEQATKTNIITALGDLLKVKAKANDRVVVFFAGHGYTEISSDGTRSGFIVPADGASSDPSTFISLDRLGELARNIPAKHVFFLMDSCFSGGLVRFRGEIGPAPRFTAEMSVKDVLAKTRFPVRQVLTCGGEGERVMEKSGHGICTKVIADGLAGEADLNGDGYVVANELSRFAAVRVQEISGGLQNPQFGYLEQKSPVLGEMVLKFAN